MSDTFRIFCLFFLMISVGPSLPAAPAGNHPHFNDQLPPGELARALEQAMTDRQVLGQVLMFGYPGERADPTILRWIKEEGLGGVKVFGRNAGNLSLLAGTVGTYQKQALAGPFGIPLLIATDQEGGWVRHIRGESSQTAGNMALGAGGIAHDAWETGRLLGAELAALGINMNFAPTVDVFVDPKADVIGPRAFAADPGQTGLMGLAFARGHAESRVIAAAKHFPGHGDTSEDSHGTLPAVTATLDTLRARDLVPYRILIAGGLDAIMVGHLAFPNITGNTVPATLSPELSTRLLREEMGFNGVVITDDLFMQGARSDGTELPAVCHKALMAGADILLISQHSSNHRRIHRELLKKMENAPFNRRVREAARRVLALKAKWLRGENAVSFVPETENLAVPAGGAPEFFLSQAARSITLVRNQLFPLPPNKAGRVLLAGTYSDFFTEGMRRYPDARTWYLSYHSSREGYTGEGKKLLRAARQYDTLIFLLPDGDMSLILEELRPVAEKVVVVSVLSPAHLDAVPWASTALAAYGTGSDSFQAVFAALAGDFIPRGTLPIPLEQLQ